MSRATESNFNELHGLLCDTLIAQLKAFREGMLVEWDGKQYVKVAPPALLAQAIKFLKDNGIDMPVQDGNKTDTLKQAMPDYSDDNIVSFHR